MEEAETTQADIDAALDYFNREIGASLSVAFARHRISAQKPLIESLAAINHQVSHGKMGDGGIALTEIRKIVDNALKETIND